MATLRKQTGNLGETLAEQYLRRQGYTIIARNWRCPVGELDVVARQGAMLVFVEVRTRRGTRQGTPEESITPAKQAKLVELAHTFLAQHHDEDCEWRIDVIAICLNRHNDITRLNHIKWAIEG